MKKKEIFRKILIVILPLLFSCSGNSSEEKYLGTWEYTININSNENLHGTMVIRKDGEFYSGEIVSDLGSVQLLDPVFNKNVFSSGFYIGESYLSLKGKFDENKFEGVITSETDTLSMHALKQEMSAAVETQIPKAIITVNMDAKSAIYNPMIFGGFLEHFGKQIYGGVFDPDSPLSDDNGFRIDVMEALKELKVPVIRWPGGCFVSGYHWQDGVGKERKGTDDMAWGVIEPNTFGTDEFIDFCRMLGAEPFICNNAGNGTIEEMRDWIEYTNGSSGEFAEMRIANGFAEPREVNYWSIGNENWGGHEIGQKTIEEWVPLVSEAAKKMKKVDPVAKLSAAAMANREWTLPLLKSAGPMLDYVSIHMYWLPLWGTNNMPDYMSCIMKSQGPEKLITDYIAILEEAGFGQDIKIAFDEWNLRSWHHPEFPRKTVQDYDDPKVISLIADREKNLIASQYTMADALFTASFFNACLRHSDYVEMANIAPLVNTRGPLFVHPEGIVKRTHFHAMSMYANMLESNVIETEVKSDPLEFKGQNIPAVDAVVTRNESGKEWSLAIVNRHPSLSAECKFEIDGVELDGTYSATVLSGDSTDAFNDIDQPNRVVPVTTEIKFNGGVANIPPHSLTILKVSKL